MLLRAGKTLYLNPNELPVAFTRRSFIQLTQFRNTKQTEGFNKYTKLNEIVQSVKYLIEYNIFNPENTQNSFTGEINVYSFTSTVLTNDEFTVTKDYPNKSLKDEELPENFKEYARQTTIDNDKIGKLIDVQPRGLFDVFDNNKVYIGITPNPLVGGMEFKYTISDDISGEAPTRMEAEKIAVEKAFEILNNKL